MEKDEIAEYLLANGYKEALGKDYLEEFGFLREYAPRRRRLFYTPKRSANGFSSGNWKHFILDNEFDVIWRTKKYDYNRQKNYKLTKSDIDKVISIHKKGMLS